MPAHVAEARTIEDVTVAAQGDPRRTEPLELSHRIGSAGEAIVNLRGELDIASAEAAVSYVKNVIDHHGAPLTVDLTALAFCDARGLAALLRMADHAEQAGCPLRLVSPRPSLVKIMRITGLDRRFLVPQASAQLIPEAHPDSLSRLPRDTAVLPPDKSQTRSLRPHRLRAGAQRVGSRPATPGWPVRAGGPVCGSAAGWRRAAGRGCGGRRTGRSARRWSAAALGRTALRAAAGPESALRLQPQPAWPPHTQIVPRPRESKPSAEVAVQAPTAGAGAASLQQVQR